MDYSGLNFYDALELPCDLFQLMLKHSIVDELSRTKEGRQYLADCDRLERTSPDLESLITLSRKGGIRRGN